MAHNLIHKTRDEILRLSDKGGSNEEWRACLLHTAQGIRDLFRCVLSDNTVECVIRLAQGNKYVSKADTQTEPSEPLPDENVLKARLLESDFRGVLIVDVNSLTAHCGGNGLHAPMLASFSKYRWATVVPIVTIEHGRRYLAGLLHVLSCNKTASKVNLDILALCADFISLSYTNIASARLNSRAISAHPVPKSAPAKQNHRHRGRKRGRKGR